MTAAVRRPTAPANVPDHGTPARYQGNRTGTRPPCKCRKCVDAHTKACALRLLAHTAGIPPRVPSGPVTEHIAALFSRGMTYTRIALAAGVSVSSVTNAAARRHPTMRRSVADKILAVRPRIVRDTDRLPAVGSRRRLQALYAQGHSSADIAAASGISDGTVRHLVGGYTDCVTAAVYVAVRNVYRALGNRRGSSARALRIASRNGWQPPAAWDDNVIDDPQAQPEYGRELNFLERGALRREEIVHFAWHGDTPEQIVDRLGGEVSISTVRQIVQDWRTGQKRQRKQVAA